MTWTSAYCEDVQGWARVSCEHGTEAYMPLRCRKCHGCARAQRGRHIARGIAGLTVLTPPGGKPAIMTLTSTPGTTWQQIMAAWSRILRDIRRENPGVQYLLVKERGALRGMLHLHILLSPWVWYPREGLSQRWRHYTRAHVVDIQYARGIDDVAVYVVKYVAKGLGSWGANGPRKVVSYSRGFPKLPKVQLQLLSLEPLLHPRTKGVPIPTERGCVVDMVTLTTDECACFGPLPDWVWAGQGEASPLRPIQLGLWPDSS